MSANPVALTIFLVLFFATAGLGFYATKMRSVNVSDLAQWGLGGRSFGTLIAWFLLGGDIYTAYTFVAVPALVAGAGATGFFAVPFTILMYPVLFLVMPRLWSVAHKHGYVTAEEDRKSTRLNSSHLYISYAVFCLKKKKTNREKQRSIRARPTPASHACVSRSPSASSAPPDAAILFRPVFFFFNDTATTEIYTPFPTRRSSDLSRR